MRKFKARFHKLVPSLALGVAITLLAALFNYLVYDARLPAMVTGNRIFADDAGDRSEGPPALRALAGMVNLADNVANDLMYAVRGPGRFPSTREQIVVVAIDEASLMRRGAWPWSRRDVARLMEKLAPARVIGLDLLFHEPDKTSLAAYVGRFERLYGRPLDTTAIDADELDNDSLLAGRIARTHTVLSSALLDGTRPARRPFGLVGTHSLEVNGPDGAAAPPAEVLLKRAEYLLADLRAIRRSVPPPAGEGFSNLFPDPNGVVRAVPLFTHINPGAFERDDMPPRQVYPSFAMEVLRVFLGGSGYRINLRGDRVEIPEFRDAAGGDGVLRPVSSVSILGPGGAGEGGGADDELLRIPLNELAEMEVGFGNHRGDYLTLPAWEVLEGRHDDAFANKAVIVGGVGGGSGGGGSGGGASTAVTPARAEMSTAEIHATMLSIMFKGDFMESAYRNDYFWQQTAIIASGLAVTLAVILGNFTAGMLASALILVGLVLINYFAFFRRGIDVGLALPFASTLAVLAVLTVANYLVVGRERRFIRKAFSLNVSPSILGFLETHPDLLSSLQGEHRVMTVLFTDIRGFTSISERMTAPNLARFLNEYFTPMSDIVMQNAGTVDKFIGDGLMAFWNAPSDNPMHARDAACAALDMVERLKVLQDNWTQRGLPTIAIGCGINSGPMFAGYMGSDRRKNYTVMGDNVNIASRLESVTRFYSSSILITEATRSQLGPGFVCRVVDKVRVSGKVSSVVTYELLGRGPATEELAEEIAAFSRVFELYQEREFTAAEALLKELVFIRPAPLYRMYLDRLAIYKALPPPADWDGTFAMTTK